MNSYAVIFTAGFAIFSMFFGSGNLVFPLQIGLESGDSYLWASLGLFLTGILIPFLGLLSVLAKGSTGLMVLERIGKVPGLVLAFMMLCLMGPFGVGARCVLVAYGGLQLVWPQLPFMVFSLIFCGFTGYIIWKKHTFVTVMGRYLSPALLGSILLIIIFGLWFSHTPPTASLPPLKAFQVGATYGYQTMDLLASFFFSGTILGYLKFVHKETKKDTKSRLVNNSALLSCSLGMGLLALVYVGFVALGAKYAPHLRSLAPEQMLTQIAGKTLGNFAMPLVSITITLACLTTLLVLVNLFSDFIRVHMMPRPLHGHWSIVITLIITFCVAQFGFKSLAIWIAQALSVVYPALIVLAFASLARDLKGFSHRNLQIVFYISLMASILIIASSG